MKKPPKPPRVAILIGTARDWGRDLVRGILSYTGDIDPWHIWIRPNSGGNYDSLPEGWECDGVIARVTSDHLAKSLNEAGVPVVNVSDSKVEGFSAPCIRTDDRASTQMAADHFLDRGFRNMAFIGRAEQPVHTWYREAYVNALEEHGLSCSIFTATESVSQDAEITAWLLSLPKPVGLLALGHNIGRTVLDLCRDAKIQVPHDIAVLTSNYDELTCHSCFPPMSGIVSPTQQIGLRAAELLDTMMNGEKVSNNTLYIPPHGIKERLSTNSLALDDPQIIKVITYIREHAFEPITTADILKAVPMARRTLDRRFYQAFGRSPSEEIKRLRINKARQLLAQTDMPMQLIAEACGYPSYNYLSTVFKQTTKTAPSKYRQQFKH